MKRTIASVAAALSLMESISACSSGKNEPDPQQTSPSPPPSTFGPANATLGFAGLVSALPDTCQAVKTSLPPGMASARLYNSFMAGPSGSQDFQECEWSALSSAHTRVFNYGLFRFKSLGDTRREMAHRRQRTSFDDDQCRYDKAQIKDMANLGEAAFAVPCSIKKNGANPETYPNNSHVYQIGGSEIDVQTRNVIIQVWWLGADYPTAEARKNPHWLQGGSELSFEQTLPQAVQVARAVLAHFPK